MVRTAHYMAVRTIAQCNPVINASYPHLGAEACSAQHRPGRLHAQTAQTLLNAMRQYQTLYDAIWHSKLDIRDRCSPMSSLPDMAP